MEAQVIWTRCLMKIICIHCGGEFTIRAQDLGGRGLCPHCRGEIALPKASTAADAEKKPERQRPTNWLEGSISGLISMVLHMLVFLAVALFQVDGGTGGAGGRGKGEKRGVAPQKPIDPPRKENNGAPKHKTPTPPASRHQTGL